jgi:hypothetical protein
VVAGHVDFPASQLRDAIEFYADLIAHAPHELSADLALSPAADGQPGAQIYVVYTGDAQRAEQVLAPLQRFGKPVKNTIARTTYLAVQSQFDGPPLDPHRSYLKGGFVREFTPALIAALTQEIKPDAHSYVYCQNANGAVADKPETATAFSHRNALVNMMLAGSWDDASFDKQGRAMIHANWDKLAPHTDGYYVNLNDADPKGADRNYGRNFARLADLKQQFDPQNLFRLNANITPGRAGPDA